MQYTHRTLLVHMAAKATVILKCDRTSTTKAFTVSFDLAHHSSSQTNPDLENKLQAWAKPDTSPSS
jgi:hypothetical protein